MSSTFKETSRYEEIQRRTCEGDSELAVQVKMVRYDLKREDTRRSDEIEFGPNGTGWVLVFEYSNRFRFRHLVELSGMQFENIRNVYVVSSHV